MIMFPTLVQGAGIDDANYLDTRSVNSWPVLLDIDAVTAETPEAANDEACCWPILEPPFRERWAAMPAAWFVTRNVER